MSSLVRASGFSQRTFLPARSKSQDTLTCCWSGIATETTFISSEDEEIDELFDQRAVLLAQTFRQQDTTLQNSRIASLNAIDMQLVRKGVTFLSQDEVYEQFPETKCDKDLSLSGQTMNQSQEDAITPRADTPESSVNSWASRRLTYKSDGIQYDIQRLIAQPISPRSPLTNIGNEDIYSNTNWIAGTTNVISTIAKAGATAIVEEIPGASLVLTLFDAVSSFINGISTSTRVDVSRISYTWSSVTTATFMYVRRSDQTDAYQWMSMICTKTVTDVGYQSPQFSYVASNGTWVLAPNVVQGTRTIYATPLYHASNSHAIAAYNSTLGEPLQNCVSYVQISGPESKRVVKINPCYPSLIIHCEI